MNTKTKNLHTGYRHDCTEVVEVKRGKETVRRRMRRKDAPSFKDWVRSRPDGAEFFARKRRAR